MHLHLNFNIQYVLRSNKILRALHLFLSRVSRQNPEKQFRGTSAERTKPLNPAYRLLRCFCFALLLRCFALRCLLCLAVLGFALLGFAWLCAASLSLLQVPTEDPVMSCIGIVHVIFLIPGYIEFFLHTIRFYNLKVGGRVYTA